MEFTNKIILITGAGHGIGKTTADAFRKEGAIVLTVDLNDGCTYKADIGNKEDLEYISNDIIQKYGHIDILVNNAPPIRKGIDNCSYEQFQYALSVGVTSAFYLTKLFKDYFAPGSSIINISSSRDRMSQPQTESYTAAKGAISALTHALSVSLAGIARVNSISPGWIETNGVDYHGPDALQHTVGRVGNPEDIANAILFLCSDKAGFINGENLCIDGGMTKLMIYHNDHGWSLEE